MRSCIKVLRDAYIGKKLMALEYGANGPGNDRHFAQGTVIIDVKIGNGEIILYFNEWGRSYIKVHPDETIVVAE